MFLIAVYILIYQDEAILNALEIFDTDTVKLKKIKEKPWPKTAFTGDPPVQISRFLDEGKTGEVTSNGDKNVEKASIQKKEEINIRGGKDKWGKTVTTLNKPKKKKKKKKKIATLQVLPKMEHSPGRRLGEMMQGTIGGD